MIISSLKIKTGPKFTYIVGMSAEQNFNDMFYIFHPTASATAYSQRPKFVRAKHLATGEGENCAYGPTLIFSDNP